MQELPNTLLATFDYWQFNAVVGTPPKFHITAFGGIQRNEITKLYPVNRLPGLTASSEEVGEEISRSLKLKLQILPSFFADSPSQHGLVVLTKDQMQLTLHSPQIFDELLLRHRYDGKLPTWINFQAEMRKHAAPEQVPSWALTFVNIGFHTRIR